MLVQVGNFGKYNFVVCLSGRTIALVFGVGISPLASLAISVLLQNPNAAMNANVRIAR